MDRKSEDRCAPLRDQIQDINDELREIRDDLADPNILDEVKKNLRELQGQLQTFLRNIEAELQRCEALPKKATLKR